MVPRRTLEENLKMLIMYVEGRQGRGREIMKDNEGDNER
jgi:hypothetical protein